jgi:short subunit fatty acids transporter
MIPSQLAWLLNISNINLSEPLWIAGWGLGLIVAAMVSRSLTVKSQERHKSQELRRFAQQRSH